MTKNGQEPVPAPTGEFVALFSQHVAVINSERSTIWQRYSAMLVANSLILGFGPDSVWVAIVGLVICILWAAMTHEGWKILRRRITVAGEFQLAPLPESANPFSEKPTDHIEGAALLVIVAFAAIYAARLLCLWFDAPWLCAVWATY